MPDSDLRRVIIFALAWVALVSPIAILPRDEMRALWWSVIATVLALAITIAVNWGRDD